MINELKFRDNPILNGLTRESSRQIVIARVAKLKVFFSDIVKDKISFNSVILLIIIIIF
jgi:hypothetical protein